MALYQPYYQEPTVTPETSVAGYTYQIVCKWCGQAHYDDACPRIKALEYHPNGTLKRVEFHDGRQQEVTGYYADNVADREWPPKISGG